jgi:predicted ATP-dependent protease
MNQTEFVEQIKPEPNQPDIVILQGENESDINNIKRKVKDLLLQFRIRDFVAMTDPADKHKILIMKKKEAETLDSFHCHHCGMEFVDEIQLGIHQRLHLPF